jgi:hypothetical protein
MCSPIAPADPRQRSTSGQVQERLPNGAAIESERLMLITEAEQTLVTGRLTLGLLILTKLIEMTGEQRRGR